MYKNIMFHQLSAGSYYRDLLAKSLGKDEWVECWLPNESYSVTRIFTFPALHSGNVIFTDLDLISHKVRSILNLPLVGFVYPILYETPNGPDHIFDDSDILARIWATASYMLDMPCTFLYLLISKTESLKIGEYEVDEWWQLTVDSLQKYKRIESRIRVAVCSIHHLDRMPSIIAEKLEIHPDSMVSSEPASRLAHPYIPNSTFRLENFGCADGASVGFVEDCLDGVVASNMPVRVWLDVMKAGDCVYHYDEQKVPLGIRRATYDSSPDNGIHVYLEYEGCAFDSMMAFQESISIYEFQKRLQSSWRTHIDIMPEMNVEEAKLVVRDAVEEARQRVLE